MASGSKVGSLFLMSYITGASTKDQLPFNALRRRSAGIDALTESIFSINGISTIY
jgi:hypothetical protein